MGQKRMRGRGPEPDLSDAGDGAPAEVIDGMLHTGPRSSPGSWRKLPGQEDMGTRLLAPHFSPVAQGPEPHHLLPLPSRWCCSSSLRFSELLAD